MGWRCMHLWKWCWFTSNSMPFSQVNGYIPGTPWRRPRAPAIRLQEAMQTPARPPVSGCPGLSVRGTPPRPPAPWAWLGDESLPWSHCTQLLWNMSAHFQHRVGAQGSLILVSKAPEAGKSFQGGQEGQLLQASPSMALRAPLPQVLAPAKGC